MRRAGFPLANAKAFGGRFMGGRQIRLAQSPGAAQRYQAVQRNYDNLVILLGREKADQALKEAAQAP